MKCKNCGAHYQTEELKCPYCGTENMTGQEWKEELEEAQEALDRENIL